MQTLLHVDLNSGNILTFPVLKKVDENATMHKFDSLNTLSPQFYLESTASTHYDDNRLMISVILSKIKQFVFELSKKDCLQWRSLGLSGWASRPPGRPKWGRKWRKF